MSLSFEVNRRLLADIRHEPQQPLTPISGYEHEPLVSLDEACRPLETLLGAELKRYILVAQLSSREPKQGLTQEESASIYLYTMEWEEPENSLYALLNRALCAPDRSELQPWLKYLKLFFTAFFKLPRTDYRVVWRGVPEDLSGLYREGDEMTWWSVSSATSSFDVLQSPMYLGRAEKRTVFGIRDTCGRPIRAYSHLQNDDEILLLPGLSLRVAESVRHTDGTHIIYLNEIESPCVQLVRPFDLLPTDEGSPSGQPLPLGAYRNPALEQTILSSEWRGNLCLNSMQLTDQDMKIVVRYGIGHKKCMGLSLRHNAITPIGAAILADGIASTYVSLSLALDGNRILDAGVQCLAQALVRERNGFISLYLNGVGMTDAACPSLANLLRTCGRMRFLHLDDNNIGDRGLRVLCEAIESHHYSLQMITFSGNKLVTDGSIDALCAAIKENPSISEINMVRCSLSAAGKERLQMTAAQRGSFVIHV